MDIVLFIGFNMLLMSAFFLLGIYQFAQIEDKRKRRPVGRLRSAVLVSELGINEAELRQLVRDEHYDDAIHRLITDADVDRFTAEVAIEALKQQEYRPYVTKKAKYPLSSHPPESQNQPCFRIGQADTPSDNYRHMTDYTHS
jgi:hypothetical protein